MQQPNGRWRWGIFGFALAVAAGPASAQQKTLLALPSISPGFTAIYVAQDKGLWRINT